ncbi:hypothetical protein Drorol1_Dr00013606 [Drosera rotundifolia]
MATRAPRPDQPQNRGGVVMKNGAQKEKKTNRTALGEIGNLEGNRQVHGKGIKINQISRPITRSFGAQLLANAQEAAKKNKKQGEQLVDLGFVAPNRARETKKGTQVPRISSSQAPVEENSKVTEDVKEKGLKNEGEKAVDDLGLVLNDMKVESKESEAVKEEKKGGEAKDEDVRMSSHGKVKERSSRKKKIEVAFSSVLTARSKVASGLARKQDDLIVNIDEAVDDELACAEYAEDIYKFYKLTEGENLVCHYMDKQPDINDKMRSILVDWLIEVHHKFELRPETLYLTVNIIDRFLSMKAVPRRELQLVGISSMLIASKYEEIWSPQVNDFVCISDRAFLNEQVLAMEKVILGKLEWYLTVPTPYMFLTRYVKASLPSDTEVENMVYFFAELGIMNYSTSIPYCPSMLAASSVYAARRTLERSPSWTETLKHYTGYSEDQLKDCTKLLVGFHSSAQDSKMKAVYNKYSKPDLGAVALCNPAKCFLA